MSEMNYSPVNRRAFMGTTAAGTLLAAAPYVNAAPSSTLKVALIGCGGRGTGAAGQTLNVGGCELVAMADAFRDRLDGSFNNLKKGHKDKVKVPDSNKFVGFDAYKKAIDLADLVILTTPPGFRPLHFEYAIAQGKHVFMEKPVAADAPGIRRVLAAAKAADAKGLKVVVGLQRRYQKDYIETLASTVKALSVTRLPRACNGTAPVFGFGSGKTMPPKQVVR